MNPTALTLAALLACTAVAGAADAAPGKPRSGKPVCQLVTDPKGDTEARPALFVKARVPDADGDDVLSADVASNRTTITAVVRPAALVATDPRAPFGRNYYVQFQPEGTEDELYLAVRTYPTGPLASYGLQHLNADGTTTSTRLGDAKAVVDLAEQEVRISVPIGAFAPTKAHLTVGRRITQPHALIGRNATPVPSQDVPTGQRLPAGQVVYLDEGFGVSYVLGTPSCVPIGR